MSNTFHFLLPSNSTMGTAIASLHDFLSCSWFCQAIFQAEGLLLCVGLEALKVGMMQTAADIMPNPMKAALKD